MNMIDPKVVYDKLAGFTTADEIAAFLRSEKVRGLKGQAEQCPIANYYRRHISSTLRPTVHNNRTSVLEPDPEGKGVRVFLTAHTTWTPSTVVFSENNTPAMHAFIETFDSGCYPYLAAVPITID